jgi:hypothetical protein
VAPLQAPPKQSPENPSSNHPTYFIETEFSDFSFFAAAQNASGEP